MENIVSSAKTDMFRIQINPVLRKQLEDVYGKNGLTLTDAVNVFFSAVSECRRLSFRGE